MSATIGGKDIEKESMLQEKTVVDIYIGIFFDGTNNNKVQAAIGRRFRQESKVNAKGFAYVDQQSQEQLLQDDRKRYAISSKSKDEAENREVAEILDDKVSDEVYGKYRNSNSQNVSYTNVAILESFYKTDATHYSLYVEGSGSDMDFDSTGADFIGLALGAGDNGVVAKVGKALDFISNFILSSKPNGQKYRLHFDVFGFSRGATAARIFNYIVYSDKIAQKSGNEELKKNSDSFVKKLQPEKDIESKEVEYLGIFDTVGSVGVVHSDNVAQYGLWATDMCRRVVHLCGMDELRKNFAIIDIESSVHSNGLELFLPGCHTDIGGGISMGRDEPAIINKVDFAGVKIVSQKVKNTMLTPMNFFLRENEDNTRQNLRFICVDPANPDTQQPVTVDTLIEMGWIDEDKQVDEFNESLAGNLGNYYTEGTFNISMFRHVRYGYSNVSLALMVEDAVKERCDMFNFRTELFPIPTDNIVEEVYNKAKTQMQSGRSGRIAISPSDYAHLRRKYLHYSANERLATLSSNQWLVNAPYVYNSEDQDEQSILTRLVYQGIFSEQPVVTTLIDLL